MDPLTHLQNIDSGDLLLGFALWTISLVIASLLTACAAAKIIAFSAKHTWLLTPFLALKKGMLGWFAMWFAGSSLMVFSVFFLIGTTGIMMMPEMISITGVTSLVLTIFLIECLFLLGFVLFP